MEQSAIEQSLIEAISHRVSAETRWGIGTAANYLRSFGESLTKNHDLLRSAILDLGLSDAEHWLKLIKESESKLTYCDPDLEIDAKSFSRSGDKGILNFDHVVTSTRKDRDGDIMECAGAEIDEKMPLLWQHMPVNPIGTYLGTTKRSDSLIAGKSAILDTALGRDAAVLVEGGALRISHGFKAYDVEQLVRKDAADKTPYGYRIKRFSIMEVSLVSVPSNTDAVITAYSREKLFHPAVKSWAGEMHANRPVIVPGVDLSEKSGHPHFIEKCSCGLVISQCRCKSESKEIRVTEKGCETCLAGECNPSLTASPKHLEITAVKQAEIATVSEISAKMYGMESSYLEGSYQWVNEKLEENARSYLRAFDKLPEYDSYSDVIATFPDFAIICACSYAGGTRTKSCYRVAWSIVDGKPKFSGDPVAVKIEASIVEKSAAYLSSKFAEIDKANLREEPPKPTNIQSVKSALIAMLDMPENDALEQLSLMKGDVMEAIGLINDQRDRRQFAELGVTL